MAKFRGSDKPKISELHDHIRGVIAPQWYDLGIQLLDDDEQAEKLDVIQSDNTGNSEKCCTAMFKYWLKVDKTASWDKLITALKHISHVTLAEKIKAMTSKGGVEKQKRKRKKSSDPESDLDDEENPASTSKPKRKRKASQQDVKLPDQTSLLAQEPLMFELTEIVIPKIKAEWESLAYCMRYTAQEVRGFKKDSPQDSDECCKNLLDNWLSTGHGPKPKTYQTLLKHIKKINNLRAASEAVEKELSKALQDDDDEDDE